MKSISSLVLFLFSICTCFAQDDDASLVLKDISNADVVYETKTAKIGFSKADILDVYKTFKEDVSYELTPEAIERINEAVLNFQKNNKQVTIKETIPVDVGSGDPITELIKIYVGAKLLNAQKAQVHRLSDGSKQKTIKVRQLIDTPEGAGYLFMFSDGTDFFMGEVYGEHSLFLESDD